MARLNAPSLRLSEIDSDHLIGAAAALGIVLEPAAVLSLTRFADILDLWSSRMNLLSCHSARELVDRHLLDSLAVAPALPDDGVVIDLGSGAGFPGIPLAILKRNLRFVLVEARRRRCTFLREVRRTLDLANVEILEQRAEVPPALYRSMAGTVVSRAVWSDALLLELAERWLARDGRLLWMRSEPLAETSGDGNFERHDLFRYRIEGDRGKCVQVFGLR